MARLFDWLKRIFRRERFSGFRFAVGRTRPWTKSEQHWPSLNQLVRLPRVLSPLEKRIFYLCLTFFFLSLTILAVRLYLSQTKVVPVVGGEYTEGLIGNPVRLNPVLAQSNDVDMDIARLVFSGLFKYDRDRNLVPDLAESYELSEDQKIYTIHLRRGVTWHDGQPFTAQDVILTIDEIQTAEIKSPLSGNLRGVTAEAADDFTVTLTLKEPFAPFLSSLTFGILPAHLWSDIQPLSFPLAEMNLKPIGTGPYKFKSLKKDRSGSIRSYALVRNPVYYQRPPYLETIVFKFYPDLESLIEAGKDKKVDGVGYIPKESKSVIAKNRNLIAHLLHLPQYTAVFLNQKNQLLKTIEVKQAMAHAINKQEIIDQVLSGEGEQIHAPILPGFLGFNPEIRKYEFDPVKAIEILEKAGWALAEGSLIRKKSDQELQLTLTTLDQPDFVATANLIKEYWQKIGFGVELRIVDPGRMQKSIIKPRDFEALLVGEIVGTDPDPYSFWHSSQGRDPGLNLSVYVNKNVDQLLEEARKTTDPEQRWMKYLHFQNLLADDLPALFLFNPTYTYGLHKKVKGFELTRITVPSDRFTEIENWYIKSKRQWK